MHLKNMEKGNGTVRKQLTRFLFLALVLLTLLGAASCTSSIPQELTTSEKLWKDQGLNNYDFTLERQCFCPEDWRGPINIKVRNGAAVSVTYLSSGAAVTEGKFDNADTINKLFTIPGDVSSASNIDTKPWRLVPGAKQRPTVQRDL